jgi:hypothetical protein
MVPLRSGLKIRVAIENRPDCERVMMAERVSWRQDILLRPIVARMASYAFDRNHRSRHKGTSTYGFFSGATAELRLPYAGRVPSLSLLSGLSYLLASGEGAESSLNVLPREWDGQSF